MFKPFPLLFLLFCSLLAKEIHPAFRFYSSGFVNSFVVNEGLLYVGNDAGMVDVFDIKTQKMIHNISLPLIESGTNKLIPQNILSVDYLNGKVLIVSIGENAYRNVWIYENFELKQIVDESKKLTIKKALFVSNERILFGTFSAEIILHDMKENYNLYTSHVTQSTMGDIVLSNDKSKMLMSYESGEVRVIDVMSSHVEQIHSSQNVDNVYNVAFNNGVLVTAGQDRRVGVYRDKETAYHLKSDFLVYAVGVSPSGRTGAYASGEKQHIQLFDTQNKVLGDRLIGHTSRINQIWFKDEKELFSTENSNIIYYWKRD
jgi:WD40 repeat protein